MRLLEGKGKKGRGLENLHAWRRTLTGHDFLSSREGDDVPVESVYVCCFVLWLVSKRAKGEV
jgi:hypothetical protein